MNSAYNLIRNQRLIDIELQLAEGVTIKARGCPARVVPDRAVTLSRTH